MACQRLGTCEAVVLPPSKFKPCGCLTDGRNWLPDCKEHENVRRNLKTALQENTAYTDLIDRLKPWLDNREQDIAHSIEDFGDLQGVFRDLFGREAKK